MKKLLIRLLKRTGLLRQFNFVFHIKINERKFKIPIINEVGFHNLWVSEVWMIQLIRELLELKKGIFIDVGVNIGQTLIKLKSVDNTVHYIGFEPNPICNFYLSQLTKINKFENVNLFPFAVAEKAGVLTLNFFSNDLTDSSASIVQGFREKSVILKKEFVPSLSISEFEEFLKEEISIIKIDVEGSELEVLKEFYNLIKINRPVVIIEILPVYNQDNTSRLNKQHHIEELIHNLRYYIFRINKTDVNKLDFLGKISTIGIHDKVEWSDYVFCPEELVEKLERVLKSE